MFGFFLSESTVQGPVLVLFSAYFNIQSDSLYTVQSITAIMDLVHSHFHVTLSLK